MKKYIFWSVILIILIVCTSVILLVSAFSTSSGIYSASDGLSSSLGFNSETVIVTDENSKKPTVTPTPIVGITGAVSAMIPKHWQPGTRSGTYYDPITKTNWIFDNILQKFYSPSLGWFLITQLSKDGKIQNQFYYEPKAGVFYDIMTGQVITGIPGMGAGSSASGNQPAGTSDSTSGQILSPSSPDTIASSVNSKTQNNPVSVNSGQSTLIPCSSCPSGYCNDINYNGICDDLEAAKISSDNIVSSEEGGLSEKPQSSILYEKVLPKSGIMPIVACTSDQKCEFCLDIDNDGACTIMDYTIIKCGNIWGLDRMASKDGVCDKDVIFIMNCTNPADCKEAQYCIDENQDGKCDEEGKVI
jgi:hypothetical protein